MNQKPETLFEAFVRKARPVVPPLPENLLDSVMSRLPSDGIRYHRHRIQRRLTLGLASAAAIAVLILTGLPTLRQSVTNPGERELVFKLEAAEAGSIHLVGDFNNWEGEPMQREGDFWVIRKRLPRGQIFKYAFMVDSELRNDVRADRFVDDGFGGKTAAVFTD